MKFNPDVSAPTNKVEGKNNYAKEAWYKACLEGNSKIPQTMEGMYFFITCAAIEDPEINWADFFSSKLSPDQIAHLMKIMNGLHAAKNIPVRAQEDYSTHQNGRKKSFAVDEERLQTLFKTVLDGVIGKLLLYTRQDTANKQIAWKEGDEQIYEINNFFDDTKNSQKIEKLKKITSLMKEALGTEEAKEILLRYRNSFRNPVPANEVYPWEFIHGELKGVINRYLEDHNIEIYNDTEAQDIRDLYF
jgi:hypothetical protein